MDVGIIGCGLIGRKRAAALGRHRLRLVLDRDPVRAEALAAGLNGVRVARQVDELLESALDAIVIATPHDALAGLTLAAVEAGKAVLVEKPAARTAAELDPVITAAAAKGVTVKVGFNHRFHPAMAKAREIVDSGVLGPLMFVRGRYGHGGRLGYEREWRCDRAVSGGGELIDQGSHLIDLARWFLGDAAEVFGVAPTYFWDIEVEDNCFLCLRTATGQVAWLHASWTEWKNMFCFEIAGRDGKLQIDGLGGSYGPERLTHYRMLPRMGPPESAVWDFDGPDISWAAEFDEFAAALREGRGPLGDIHDAKAMLDIIAKVYGERRA